MLFLNELHTKTLLNFFVSCFYFRKEHLAYFFNYQKNIRKIVLGGAEVHSPTEPLFDQMFPDMVYQIEQQMALMDCPKSLKPALAKELQNFLHTGNCEPIKDCVCINPTMLETFTSRWLVHYSACPFDGYFPIPYQQLASNTGGQLRGKVMLRHCQSVLKDFILKLRARRSKVTFYFHIEDCLKLCLFNPELKNRFQVIDTSNLADHVGLVNLIYTATDCLEDSPDSLLFSESMTWKSLKSSVADYIETCLCCPISMIPTLYGVRLVNHVRLGNPVPFDALRMTTSPVSLVWQNVPVYSANIRLEISPAVLRFTSQLQSICFFRPEVNPYPMENCAIIINTPMTFFYVVQSLINRYNWQNSVELLLKPVIPERFKLAWKTQQEWFTGKEVLQYQLKFPNALPARTINPGLRLLIIPSPEVIKFCVSLGSCFPELLIKGAQYVDNIQFVTTKNSDGNVDNFFLSFLLPKNHGLSAGDWVYLVDGKSSTIIIPVGCLATFNESVVKNNFPSGLNRAASSRAVKIVSCSESESQYKLNIILKEAKLNTNYGQLSIIIIFEFFFYHSCSEKGLFICLF